MYAFRHSTLRSVSALHAGDCPQAHRRGAGHVTELVPNGDLEARLADLKEQGYTVNECPCASHTTKEV